MSTLNVLLHPSDGAPIPGVLSTDHPSSSYGQPVLVLDSKDAGVSYDAGRRIAFGPADVTSWGVAAALSLTLADPRDSDQLLIAWRRLRRLALFAAGETESVL